MLMRLLPLLYTVFPRAALHAAVEHFPVRDLQLAAAAAACPLAASSTLIVCGWAWSSRCRWPRAPAACQQRREQQYCQYQRYCFLHGCVPFSFYVPSIDKSTRSTTSEELAPFRFRLAAKAALAISFPFPCKPTSLGFAWRCRVLFVLFRLDGRQPVCDSKTKNHTKIHHCQVRSSFAGAEKRSGNEKPAGNTLCVLARALKQHGRFSARQKPCALVN